MSNTFLHPLAAPPDRRVERFETVVIGGGQAGLAAGYHLAQRDADYIILDASARTGDSWRKRWDMLRLFTPARYSGLPGMVFPAPPDHLPDKDEVADYLERYAERFDLAVRRNTKVDSLSFDGARYIIETKGVRFEADSVIVATGPFHSPNIPAMASELRAEIQQLHSSHYASPFEVRQGPVLVVGAGNSGVQIALELSRTREVTLSGAVPGYLPREFLGRDIYDWIWPIINRFTRDTAAGKLLQRRTAKADPLIGTTPREIGGAGIRRVGRLTEVRNGLPVCDGLTMDVRSIVWATGFSPDYSWIHMPIALERGRPVNRRGVVDGFPGLYFLGLRWQHRLTSALLGGVGADAAFIADQVSGEAGTPGGEFQPLRSSRR